MSQGPGSRQLVVGLLRTVLTVATMVAVYYLAPLDRAFDVRIGLWLVVGLLALGVAIAWQVRAITVSETPRLRAAQTIAVGLPLLLLLFAEVYLLISHNEPGSFTEPLSRTGALYFTMTVFATVGFGDIAPVTDQTRVITMAQMVVGLIVVGIVARLLLGAVQRAVGRKESSQDEDERPRA
jgi:voltage-gated potassium channel